MSLDCSIEVHYWCNIDLAIEKLIEEGIDCHAGNDCILVNELDKDEAEDILLTCGFPLI